MLDSMALPTRRNMRRLSDSHASSVSAIEPRTGNHHPVSMVETAVDRPWRGHQSQSPAVAGKAWTA